MKNKIKTIIFSAAIVRILLSVTIAIALWAYVITVVSPNSEETFYNIPVNLRGENILNDRGLMVTSIGTTKVSMKVSGNRTDLNKLTNENITLVLDLSTIDQPGKQTLNYAHAFPGNVGDDAVTVLERSPGQIAVTIERKVTKVVPITLNYTGRLDEQYIADKENVTITSESDMPLESDSIRISGPESVLNQIDHAVIDVDLTGRNETLRERFEYTLCDKDGVPVDAELVTADVDEVYIVLFIQQVKEIPLRVEVVSGGGATQETSQIVYGHSTIKIAASESVLAGISELLLGTVNLGDYNVDTELTFPIQLPEGVTNITGINEVKVAVKFPKLVTKNFIVKNIEAVNVPSGYTADILTEEIEVTVRGSKELIEKMTDADLSVFVDFTDAQTGTFTARANISMAEAFLEVGAIGTYNVSVTMRQG